MVFKVLNMKFVSHQSLMIVSKPRYSIALTDAVKKYPSGILGFMDCSENTRWKVKKILPILITENTDIVELS